MPFIFGIFGAFTPLQILTGTPLPDGSIGNFYFVQLFATGGKPPYTWVLTSGTLPDGLSFDGATGIISGTPTTAVSMDAVTFSVTDSA